jgi:hypothetical protein
MTALDLAESLDSFRTHRHRNRQVLLESAEGHRCVYDSVEQAIVALKPRRAKASDWILVKKVEGTGQRWVFVPDMVKRIKASKLKDISEDGEMVGTSLMSDPLLQALDAESLEIVFASMRGKSKKGQKRERNFSSSTISTCTSSSSMASSDSCGSHTQLGGTATLPRPISGDYISAMAQGRTRSAPATRDRRYMD